MNFETSLKAIRCLLDDELSENLISFAETLSLRNMMLCEEDSDEGLRVESLALGKLPT